MTCDDEVYWYGRAYSLPGRDAVQFGTNRSTVLA